MAKRKKDDILDDLEDLGVEITPALEKAKNKDLEAMLVEKKEKPVKEEDSKETEDIPPRLTQAEGAEDNVPEPETIKQEKGDYLRKYQCKKITVNGKTWHAIGGEETDPEPNSKAARMKAFLLKQKKVSTLIYPEPGSAAGVPFTVNLNGYRLDLPKNTYIEIPEQVASVIRKAQQQQIAALDIPLKIDPEHVSAALKG